MRVTSARLLAHRCCICLLLSIIIFIKSGIHAKSTEGISHREYADNQNSYFDSQKGKCQFNLTDSSQSLEVDSSTYQHRGFSQCEYLIQAPGSRFILLNFTDIRSQSDMLVEPGAWSQQSHQAVTPTITPIKESQLSKTLLRKPLNTNKDVNTTGLQPQKTHQPTAVDTTAEDPILSHPTSLHNSSAFSRLQLPGNSDSSKRQPVTLNTLSEGSAYEQGISPETLRSDQSVINKDFGSPPPATKDTYLELSTSSRTSDLDIQTNSIAPSHNCSLKLIIEEVNVTSGASPQVICWGKSRQARIPIVFQYSVPIRITYVWDRRSHSGFSLDLIFLRPEEVDYCLFRCNNLCLPKKQLCDGHTDCPDHSDEHSSACVLASEQDDSDDSQVIKVLIVIVISVIVGVIVAISLVFMINQCRCYDGVHRGGGSLLQPPHSNSSEVCRTPSGSMQESGQYEPMLHQHPQRQAVPLTLSAASHHCSEHQQLLQQQHQPEMEQLHLQQPWYPHHTHRSHGISQPHYMSQEHQLRSLTSAASTEHHHRPKRPQHHQLQQKCVHHPQQKLEQQQQRQCKQAHKNVSPSELYPPNIPLSADGEEGYAMSQRALHSKQQLERNWQAENEVFRPPPNKTVYDRDSPPPPYSLNPPGTKSLDSLVPPVGAVCVLRQARSSLMHQGSPTGVPRSHSLSCHQ